MHGKVTTASRSPSSTATRRSPFATARPRADPPSSTLSAPLPARALYGDINCASACSPLCTAQLQLPYTLKQSGWVGISIILLSAFVADYTGKILIKCLNYDAYCLVVFDA